MRIAELEESLKSLIKESTQVPTDQELTFGMTGKNVEDYQAALQSIGITPGPIDGKFGRETKAATMVFQNKQNLTPDGIAGKRTINSLNQLLKFGNLQPQPQSKEKPKTKTKTNWGRVNPDHASKLFNMFTDAGYSDVVAAALVGNFSVESLWTGNPAKALNPKDTNGLPSRGLAQWQPDRWKKLGKMFNIDPKDTTLDQQAEFVIHELKTDYKNVHRQLMAITSDDSSSLKQAVFVVRRYYEIASAKSESQRRTYAQLALDTFGGPAGAPD